MQISGGEFWIYKEFKFSSLSNTTWMILAAVLPLSGASSIDEITDLTTSLESFFFFFLYCLISLIFCIFYRFLSKIVKEDWRKIIISWKIDISWRKVVTKAGNQYIRVRLLGSAGATPRGNSSIFSKDPIDHEIYTVRLREKNENKNIDTYHSLLCLLPLFFYKTLLLKKQQ